MRLFVPHAARVCAVGKNFYRNNFDAPTILVEQGINHIERYGTQCFGLCSLCFYVVQHQICQSAITLKTGIRHTREPRVVQLVSFSL